MFSNFLLIFKIYKEIHGWDNRLIVLALGSYQPSPEVLISIPYSKDIFLSVNFNYSCALQEA